MSTYAFILGKHPHLSISEIWHRYPEGEILLANDDFLLTDLNKKITQEEFDQLGGCIKAGKVIGECKKDDLVSCLASALVDRHEGSKLSYGISIYGSPEKLLRSLLLRLKKELRSKEISSRFINHQFKNISAAQYKSIKEKGVELLILRSGGRFQIAEVIGMQDIDAYSKRDYEKPFRDMKMGMMPPKMAQILINIAQSDSIWDPFCGSGTLVMEGLLMDKQMVGSDINQKHVDGSRKNADWLKKNWKIQAESELFVHDATKLIPESRFLAPVGAIAFEGDLGLPHNQNINSDLLNKIIVQLTDLYIQFFERLAESGFKGVVVAALPYFKLKNGSDIMMDSLIKKIVQLGFKRKLLLPGNIDSKDAFVLKYSRSGQAVGRGIYKFEV